MRDKYSKLDAIKKNTCAIILSNSKDYPYVSIKLLKKLTIKQKMAGLYVNTNLDFQTILEGFKKEHINKSKVQVIATGKKDEEGLTRIKSPGSLTELSILMTKNLNTGKFKFILIDSINGTMLYNEADATTRFFSHLMQKSKLLGIIAIGVNDPKIENMLPLLSLICNNVIKI